MEDNNQNKPNEEEAYKKFIEENDPSLGNAYQEEAIKEEPVQETVMEEKPRNLGVVRNHEYEGRQEAHEAVVQKFGWTKINMDNLPSRRKGFDFYKEGCKLAIKAADTPQVRAWSEINEQDPFSVDEAFNDMLTTCCMVSYDDGTPGSYKDLLEEDRIYILLEIRSLTYPEPEMNLSFQAPCGHCGTENDLTLENKAFRSVDIDSVMQKYYNSDTRSFMVRTKSYGNIELKPPTIGIMQQVSRYVKEKRDMRQKPDLTFIKILPYIAGTWKGLNPKKIKEIEVKYASWGSKKFSLVLDLCSKARVGIDTEMFTECKSCQEEVAAPITFPGGIQALFVVSDFSGELL